MPELTEWLEQLGLARYATNFAENEVEFADLNELSDDDLREIGLPLGPRRRVLKALRNDVDNPVGVRADGKDVSAGVPTASTSAERRQLTVLFCDLVGSTKLSTLLDPEDYREVIRGYQDVCAGVVTRYDGYVAKFMGDGVLAYFGWPQGHENDAERAINAGLDLADAIKSIAVPGSDRGKQLAVRIGISTGPVVVGDIIGQGAAQEAAVTGETPNLAARLQELAEPNTVVVSQSARQLTGNLFDYVSLGSRALKGIAEPVEAFSVFGQRAVESRFEARASKLLPLIGRDQELALLIERWTQVEAGEGQGVLLIGEAGIGKSRIVHGLLDRLADRNHVRVRYQCSPFQAGSALWPVIQQIRFAAGLEATDTPEVQVRKLHDLFGHAETAPLELALLAELSGIEGVDTSELTELTPQVKRDRTLEALVQQLIALATDRPVIMILEDAHWLDPTTLELMERCLEVVREARVMILLTSRPDKQPELAGHPHVTRLTLNRLGRHGLKEIIDRLGGDKLPDTTIEAIISRTDGVPLFVEELTKAVLETGEATIPASLHDSLMSRLDRHTDVKEIAQTAACIGREFDFDILSRVTERPRDDLNEALDKLLSAELIFRRGPHSDAAFIFKHALVRDAAYESLLKSRRQAVHARLVDVMEERGTATAEEVALHAEAADLPQKACEFWEVAGQQALSRPAYEEAIVSYRAAVRLCRVLGNDAQWKRRELTLQIDLGQALIARFGYQAPDTMAAFERALSLADEIGDNDLLVPSLFGLWASRYIAGIESASLADRLELIVTQGEDDGTRCVSLRMQALEFFMKADFHESLKLVEQALALYDPSRHSNLALRYAQDPRAAATNYKAWNLWHLGHPEQSANAAEEALQWALQIDHPTTIGITQCYGIAQTNIWLGNVARVRKAAEEVVKFAEEKSLELWGTWGKIYLGWAMFHENPQTGFDEVEAGLERAVHIGARRLQALHFGLAADMYSKRGRHDQANTLFERAIAALNIVGEAPYAADIYRYRAAARLRQQPADTEMAKKDLLKSRQISRDQRACALELRASCDLAALAENEAEKAQAHGDLTALRRQFEEGVTTPDLARADELLAQLT